MKKFEEFFKYYQEEQKNNPILVGEPGTGKTAIAEGLAHRIITGDVPENLKDKQVFALDMGALVTRCKIQRRI